MGMTLDADTPIPSDSWLYYDQESTFVYNPDKARELLAAEGWVDLDGNGVLDYPVEGAEEPKHLRLSLYVYEDPTNDVRFSTANMIADMLKEVGIDAHVETGSYTEIKDGLQSGDTVYAKVETESSSGVSSLFSSLFGQTQFAGNPGGNAGRDGKDFNFDPGNFDPGNMPSFNGESGGRGSFGGGRQ